MNGGQAPLHKLDPAHPLVAKIRQILLIPSQSHGNQGSQIYC